MFLFFEDVVTGGKFIIVIVAWLSCLEEVKGSGLFFLGCRFVQTWRRKPRGSIGGRHGVLHGSRNEIVDILQVREAFSATATQ